MRNNFEVGLVVAGVLSAIILLVMGVSVLIAANVMLGIIFLGLSLEDEMKAGENDESIRKLTQEKEDYHNLLDNVPENMDLNASVLWKKINSFRD